MSLNHNELIVRFTGHAGLCLRSQQSTIVIDPWRTDSTVESPHVQGLTGRNTIDYLIPPADFGDKKIEADAILLSHYHSHHAPLHDIQELVKTGKPQIEIAGPLRMKAHDTFAREKIAEVRADVKWREITDSAEWTIGDMKIRALSHTRPYHLAWFIEHPGGSILHVADAATNRRPYDKRLDPLWLSYADLKADHLFVSTGEHWNAGVNEGRPYIVEGNMDPISVAYLAHILQPKCLSLIGIYNFSVWKNRAEYVLPVSLCEEQTIWGLQKLSPHIRFVHLLPGKEFRFSRHEGRARIDEVVYQDSNDTASSATSS